MRTVAAVLAVGLVGLAAAAPASGATAQRCNQLRGTVKINDGTIKVVERKVDDRRLKGARLFGCTLPRGKVFAIGERGTPRNRPGDPNSVQYQLGMRAGRHLAISRSFGDGVAQIQDTSDSVVDLSNGRSRTYFRGSFGENACEGREGTSSADTPPVARLVLHRSGSFAVLYANPDPEKNACSPNDGRALLVGFGNQGARVTLDLAPIADIPADSVTVDGSTFSWTNAGQPRSEVL